MPTTEQITDYVTAALSKMSAKEFAVKAHECGIAVEARGFVRQMHSEFQALTKRVKTLPQLKAEHDELTSRREVLMEAVGKSLQDVDEITSQRNKCEERLGELSNEMAAADLASENLTWLRSYCPELCECEPSRIVSGQTPQAIINDVFRKNPDLSAWKRNSWTQMNAPKSQPRERRRLVTKGM